MRIEKKIVLAGGTPGIGWAELTSQTLIGTVAARSVKATRRRYKPILPLNL
jgi:hypothetical protein